MATSEGATNPPFAPGPVRTGPFGRDGAPAPATQRRTGRSDAAGVRCDRGLVLDLSVRGVRLLTRKGWPSDATRTITLESAATRISLTARCVWSQRVGFMRHSVGLSFELTEPAQARAVAELALRRAASAHARAA